MLIKTFTIPIIGGEAINDELNTFLRTQKVLHLEKHLIVSDGSGFWCFCVTWLDGAGTTEKEKVDYKKILDEPTFQRFSKFRAIRKRLAEEEAIPAYAIFKDEELAALAKLGELTISNMKSVRGIGEKKVEKYGKYFTELEQDATSQ